MHRRRTLPAPTPERAGSLVQRELAREARLRDCMLPVTVSSDPLRRFAPPPLGHQGEALGVCARRTALHTEAGGPIWASAPTRRTVEAPAGTTCFRAAFFFCTSFRAASILRQPHFSPRLPLTCDRLSMYHTSIPHQRMVPHGHGHLSPAAPGEAGALSPGGLERVHLLPLRELLSINRIIQAAQVSGGAFISISPASTICLSIC